MVIIRDWAQQQLGGPRTLILEVGAHNGSDTKWLAQLPGAAVHAFEPAPNNPPPTNLPPNVRWHMMAVGDRCGTAPFLPSLTKGGQRYTKSGSLLRPTGHLREHPEIAFGWPTEVQVTTLDAWAEQWLSAEDVIDLIWLDVQGAEGLVVAGGSETLGRTRWLFTEYSDVEQYEGQPSLFELLQMLPGWKIEMKLPYDVLLANEAWR